MGEMQIYLVAYDDAWPERFAEESRAIFGVLGGHALAVEHIGSTAIPRIAAKPVIDIMVLIESIAAAPALFEPLERLDYHYYPYAEDVTPERRWFCKPGPAHRTHHLHLVQACSPFHRDHLLFRDYLRAHPDEAARYEALKRDLAARFPEDREAYTDAKGPFVRAVLEKAREARARE
jgi:GrpB-like predicted nucleotidyltransferase (UPF0157 family)